MTTVASPAQLDHEEAAKKASRRKRRSARFYVACVAIATLSVVVLVVLLVSIFYQGHTRLTADLLTNAHSELHPEQAGMWPAIVGSLCVTLACAMAALPLGIGTAIFLEEFQPKAKSLRWLHGFIQLNISNLAGVPSIVYGLLGLSVFVYTFNLFGQLQVNEPGGWEIAGVEHYYQVLSLESGQTLLVPQTDLSQPTIKIEEPIAGLDPAGNAVQIDVWEPGTEKPFDPEVRRRTVRHGAVGGAYERREWYYLRLPLGRSFLAAGLTLALVILPIIIIAAQEALRSIPPSSREAALGLGATTWQTTRNVCLPAAMPGIMTGAILALGRAIGEAAPILIVLGAVVSKNTGPQNLLDNAVTMPVLIFNWAGRQQAAYQEMAAAAIIVLLVILLLMNSVAIYLRQKMHQS